MAATYAVRFIEAPPNARRSSSPPSLRWNVTPMCSRCMSSCGASEHITSIASWSPRKSEPLTVSYACERQSSSTLMAALMPPAAATECERTGWTLLMIATLAPFSAAASAARWPARPAPMINTSCAGMAPWSRLGKRGLRVGLYNARAFGLMSRAALASHGRTGGPGGSQRLAELRERHDALQHALAVHRHHRPETAHAFGAQQRFQWRLLADAHRQVLL